MIGSGPSFLDCRTALDWQTIKNLAAVRIRFDRQLGSSPRTKVTKLDKNLES